MSKMIGKVIVPLKIKISLWDVIKLRLVGILLPRNRVTIQDLIDKDKVKAAEKGK